MVCRQVELHHIIDIISVSVPLPEVVIVFGNARSRSYTGLWKISGIHELRTRHYREANQSGRPEVVTKG